MNLWCWFFDHKWERVPILDSLAMLLFRSPVEQCRNAVQAHESGNLDAKRIVEDFGVFIAGTMQR